MEKEGARSGRYPVAGGVLAVATCIFLAGVFLTADAARAGDTALAQRLRLQTLTVAAVSPAGASASTRGCW
ncbi:hypothetical protein [Mycobacterium sp. URHB0021]